MRHRKSGRSLSRSWEHRKAMFRNMAKSLVTHEKIKTTLPKAKELSRVADRLVTLALRGDLSAKREAYKVLGNHKLVKRLFDDIAPRFETRNGGYTRVVKYARPRVGDSAELALIEFTYNTSTEPPAKKTVPQDSKAAAAAPAGAPVQGVQAPAEDTQPSVSEQVQEPEKKAEEPEHDEPQSASDTQDKPLQEEESSQEKQPQEPDDDPERTK